MNFIESFFWIINKNVKQFKKLYKLKTHSEKYTLGYHQELFYTTAGQILPVLTSKGSICELEIKESKGREERQNKDAKGKTLRFYSYS